MFLPLVEWGSLHEILLTLYAQMMPMCNDLSTLAAGIAGLGALFYVAYRVWQSLARAEPIDVFPLLRPFVIGFCILLFQPVVLNTLNGVLRPLVQGTHEMLKDQVLDMKVYQDQKDRLEWENEQRNSMLGIVTPDPEYDAELRKIQPSAEDQQALDIMYEIHKAFSLKQMMLDFLRWLLEILFETASLVIDTIRTFYLIVLSILGPIAFAISVWDGFHATLTQWLSRYITVYLWLPVADLFSCMLAKLQSLSLARDIELIGDQGLLPDASNTTYIIFMLIGIFGYFTIPTVASWIVQAGGMGAYNRKVSGAASKVGNVASAVVGAGTGNIAGKLLPKK